MGNVLVTVSDKKLGHDASNGTYDYYNADVASAQDFYLFGMKMPSRQWSNDTYRYGFNGKEEDDEVKGDGNEIDYGMRLYDTRIGRFLSIDPLSKSFPWYTPYQFASNSPVIAVDMDGMESIPFWVTPLLPVSPVISQEKGKDIARGFYNRAVSTVHGLGVLTIGSFETFWDMVKHPEGAFKDSPLDFRSTLVPQSKDQRTQQIQFWTDLLKTTEDRLYTIINDYGTLIKKTLNGDGEAAGELLFEAILALIPADEAVKLVGNGVRQFSLEKNILVGTTFKGEIAAEKVTALGASQGEWGRLKAIGELEDYNYLKAEVDPKIFETPEGREWFWENVNKPYLDKVVEKGGKFKLIDDPNSSLIYPGGDPSKGLNFFGKEAEYIKNLIKEGKYVEKDGYLVPANK